MLGAAAWHLWRVPGVHHTALGLGRVAVSAAVLLGGAVAASRLPVALEWLSSAKPTKRIDAKDLGIMFRRNTGLVTSMALKKHSLQSRFAWRSRLPAGGSCKPLPKSAPVQTFSAYGARHKLFAEQVRVRA